MKLKNSKVLIGIISSILLVSTTFSLIPFFKHYIVNNIKKSISLYSNNINNSNYRYTETVTKLIENLNYIHKYMSTTLISKERLLRLSIMGGRYSKSSKYKHDHKRKASVLASISSHLKWVDRYSKQVEATIDYSTDSLTQENKLISKIIPIIKNHPYTYSVYLAYRGYVIPNINFFIRKNNSFGLNSLLSKENNITSNKFNLKSSNTNINSISLSSEEAEFNAKKISLAGSSLLAALTKNVTFQAKVIIFDSSTNSYKFANPISKKITVPSVIDDSSKDNKYNSGNKRTRTIMYSNRINSSLTNYSRTKLSIKYSSFAKIPTIIIGPSTLINLPGYFNSYSKVVAKSRVMYNKIFQFNINYSLYLSVIFGEVLFVTSTWLSIGHIYAFVEALKFKMYKRSIREDFHRRILHIEITARFKMNNINNITELNNFEEQNNLNLTKIAHQIDIQLYFPHPKSKTNTLLELDTLRNSSRDQFIKNRNRIIQKLSKNKSDIDTEIGLIKLRIHYMEQKNFHTFDDFSSYIHTLLDEIDESIINMTENIKDENIISVVDKDDLLNRLAVLNKNIETSVNNKEKEVLDTIEQYKVLRRIRIEQETEEKIALEKSHMNEIRFINEMEKLNNHESSQRIRINMLLEEIKKEDYRTEEIKGDFVYDLSTNVLIKFDEEVLLAKNWISEHEKLAPVRKEGEYVRGEFDMLNKDLDLISSCNNEDEVNIVVNTIELRLQKLIIRINENSDKMHITWQRRLNDFELCVDNIRNLSVKKADLKKNEINSHLKKVREDKIKELEKARSNHIELGEIEQGKNDVTTNKLKLDGDRSEINRLEKEIKDIDEAKLSITPLITIEESINIY